MRGDESRWNDETFWRGEFLMYKNIIVETVYCIQNAKSWKFFSIFHVSFLNCVAPSCEKKSLNDA